MELRIRYIGKEDFVAPLAPSDNLGALKIKAMDKFGLERSAASHYVIRHEQLNLPDRTTVAEILPRVVGFESIQMWLLPVVEAAGG